MFGGITAEHLSASAYCLVIGASDYDCSGLRPLPAASIEAMELAAALSANAGLAIPAANVECLTGGNATVDAVKAALKDLRHRATPNTTIFVYFAGHGTSLESAEGCGANVISARMTSFAKHA